ncbi:MAG: hypothetical protein IJV90_01350 [Candidatus Methanomethylophilaceae archaeon]|nr:hypothetical protein [Candidatus Methanomethylophilaceae archaeon]
MARPRKHESELCSCKMAIGLTRAEYEKVFEIQNELSERLGRKISQREMVMNALVHTYCTGPATDSVSQLEKTFAFTDKTIAIIENAISDLRERNASVRMAIEKAMRKDDSDDAVDG